ncbi:alpha/beta hydrolase [Actinosynnema sp. NPDC020468]|uniref:alpha/beta hydrolase n=1 Tax=Actinosynnema sp. NPDC020468 TaxID=3154488 RepID=UPI0034000DA2
MIHLEPAAVEFAAATAHPPYLHQLDPSEGRKVVDEAQAGPVDVPPVDEEFVTVRGVPVRIVRPVDARGSLPVLLYLHGGGWVFGGVRSHDRLVRELAVGTGAAVVFPDYSRSPEARYPVALEEVHAVARWVVAAGEAHGLDASRVAVAGDSAGGNLAAALTLLAKRRGDVVFRAQVLFYPVTDASFDTPSYREFGEGYFLRRDSMEWLWDQYLPDHRHRAESTASPLRAALAELEGLPPALVVTAEADVLRDEGEAYADRLRAAGVPVTAVRYQGVIHDFVLLNGLRGTRAASAAIAQAISVLREAFV